ncbi:metallophosphoesterase [Fulvivirgaceae bacterium BMA12]|uniref:Metallophosphoesterase n=1 Tax=Agaribacillus aureus TaxID=3051825 RepID=A0ABT8L318_9BACT|nr:metallophosphoesterase [Fulvivirgaceae bacterium BMA12]
MPRIKHQPLLSLLALLFCANASVSQVKTSDDIPAIHSNIHQDEDGRLYINHKGEKIYETPPKATYRLTDLKGNPKGTDTGISFDFNNPDLHGKMYYGFIPYGDAKHPLPVYFKTEAKIENGKSAINIAEMRGKYDMIGWEQSEKGTVGYRIVDSRGTTVYDGKITFKGKGPFEIDHTLIEGPFVNRLTPDGATISFETNLETAAKIIVNGRTFNGDVNTHHEILVSGLEPNKKYNYEVIFGNTHQEFYLTTAPLPGTRSSFKFSYASDSRNGKGGGERNVHGANFYIMKKIMALSKQQNVAFTQFSGDLINGYLTDKGEINLQYANWKRAVEPFWHYFPVYISMGNHEILYRRFDNKQGQNVARIDRFPYKTESAEAVFAANFVNPENGPVSEDGAIYDPNPMVSDFPPYAENVFYYTYDNVAVIVLNSNYFFSPSFASIPHLGGGLHGYIMDQQLSWLESTLQTLEVDNNIDHIFLTQHTPFFPNGGHVKDDMWYNGQNSFRPYVAGEPLAHGIIERRDQLLDLIVNKSSKVIAILTGDEHNYARTEIGPNTNIYPKNYNNPKVKLSRTIFQINNGAAGAPYYAQEPTPWSSFVSGFTTQNALVLFHVSGDTLEVEVINPDTLEKFDSYKLR